MRRATTLNSSIFGWLILISSATAFLRTSAAITAVLGAPDYSQGREQFRRLRSLFIRQIKGEGGEGPLSVNQTNILNRGFGQSCFWHVGSRTFCPLRFLEFVVMNLCWMRLVKHRRRVILMMDSAWRGVSLHHSHT